MKRLMLAIVAGLTVFGLVFGAAASLSVGTDQLASGSSLAVSGCDDAVSVSFGLAAGDISNVAEITIDGIDATACGGETIHVEVLGGTSPVTATGIVGATSETLPLSGTVPADSLSQVNITITG